MEPEPVASIAPVLAAVNRQVWAKRHRGVRGRNVDLIARYAVIARRAEDDLAVAADRLRVAEASIEVVA